MESLRYVAPGGDRPPGIWGKVEWTEDGRRDIASKAYRYLSPVVLMDGDSSALSIAAVALTNRPALQLEAVEGFRERFPRAALAAARVFCRRRRRQGATDYE